MIVRILFTAVVVLGLVLGWVRCGHRPDFLPLATSCDGPAPAEAAGVLVMLHGHGGSGSTTDWIIAELRRRGVGPETGVVMVDGPFGEMTGRSWGVDRTQQNESVARVRALIAGWRRANPGLRVVVAGFSRGADLAVRVAARDSAVSGLVTLSGCEFDDVARVVARRDLAVTIVHGTNDRICSNRDSRALAEALRSARRAVTVVDHAEDHTIPPVALDALARMLQR